MCKHLCNIKYEIENTTVMIVMIEVIEMIEMIVVIVIILIVLMIMMMLMIFPSYKLTPTVCNIGILESAL